MYVLKSPVKFSWDLDGKMIPFGPKTSKGQMELPQNATAEAVYTNGLSITYTFEFDGKNLKPSSINFSATRGVRQVHYHHANVRGVARKLIEAANTELLKKLTTNSEEELAALYMSEHVFEGSGRKLLQTLTGWSRTNVNYHLNKLADLGLIPADRTRTADV